jgi:PAT family beta-lactamase induction signal transducer AmpG
MTSDSPTGRKPPAAWVPTLYFAEGLPFYAVNFMALLFYQRMGVSNAVTTVVVSLLAWPWTLKPLWSPLLEMYRTKRFFVVLMQLVGGLGLLLLAFSLPLPGYFGWSIAILTVVAFASSTHDIAADGVYIASLSPKEQAAFAGALMNLGVILPGAVSGWIQEQLGYRRFFVWVLVSAIPAIVLSRFIPIRGGARASADEGAAA